MTDRLVRPNAEAGRLARALRRPASRALVLAGWVASTALFVGIVRALGGPTEGDASVSVYSTWAVGHGAWACVYSPAARHLPSFVNPFTSVAPLYPLVSGALVALLRIGSRVPFPSGAALGHGCRGAVAAMYHWSLNSASILPTVRLGYVAWLFLLAGVVAVVRTTKWRSTYGEVAATLGVALVPQTWMCLTTFFHPQDLMALGLALVGVGLARRGHWAAVGAVLALAIAAQQFAVLVLTVLVVVAPRASWGRLAAGFVSATAVVDVPLVAVAGWRALRPVLVGSGLNPAVGGAVLTGLHLHGASELVVSRLLPILAAALVAAWLRRRLGDPLAHPAGLVGAVVAALLCRLALEQNFVGYYLMAAAVGVALLAFVSGQLGGATLVWLGVATAAFSPVPWGFQSNGQSWGLAVRLDAPTWLAVAGLVVAAGLALRRRFPWYLPAGAVLVLAAFGRYPWSHGAMHRAWPHWVWQVVLVVSAAAIVWATISRDVAGTDARRDLGYDPV